MPRHDPNIMRAIQSIASEDSIVARAALIEIHDILESPDKQLALRDYEELFLKSICQQFIVR